MPKIKYQDKRFNAPKLVAIDRANSICRQYARTGYDLTLRQVYYQFVARGWLPNTVQSYNWLGNLISDARMAGLIDWNHIVDRTRNLRSVPHFNDPQHAMNDAAESYYNSLWRNQPHYVEVWVEKDALAGVVGRAATTWDCPYFSCRGYTSQSELWGAAQRIGNMMRAGKHVTVLHLGDHDPSGIDMTRDISERLMLFIARDHTATLSTTAWAALDKIGVRVERLDDLTEPLRTRVFDNMRVAEQSWGVLTVDRIALNMDQVEQYGPPPNPAKVSDPRAKRYIEQHGYESWELDALPPDVLDTLIQREIRTHIDMQRWDRAVTAQEADRATMQTVSRNWPEVVAYARQQGWLT